MEDRHVKQRPIDPALPVTPMLDMSFLLLAFFMLTFNPMPSEGRIPVDLWKIPVPKDETRPELFACGQPKDEYTVSVHSAQGDIGLMSFRGPFTPSVDLPDGNKLIALRERLNAIPRLAGRGTEAISLTIESSPGLNDARLIEVMDVCQSGGFESLSVTPLKNE